MIYVACDLVAGDARLADAEELCEFAWLRRAQLTEYVPYGFFEPVQQHLDAVLTG